MAILKLGDTVVVHNHPHAPKGLHLVLGPINANSVGVAPLSKNGTPIMQAKYLAAPCYVRPATAEEKLSRQFG